MLGRFKTTAMVCIFHFNISDSFREFELAVTPALAYNKASLNK